MAPDYIKRVDGRARMRQIWGDKWTSFLSDRAGTSTKKPLRTRRSDTGSGKGQTGNTVVFFRPSGLYHNDSTLSSCKTALNDTETNECLWDPIKFYL